MSLEYALILIVVIALAADLVTEMTMVPLAALALPCDVDCVNADKVLEGTRACTFQENSYQDFPTNRRLEADSPRHDVVEGSCSERRTCI